MSALQNRRALFMKKAIVMAGVLFALTMTAGCGSPDMTKRSPYVEEAYQMGKNL